MFQNMALINIKMLVTIQIDPMYSFYTEILTRYNRDDAKITIVSIIYQSGQVCFSNETSENILADDVIIFWHAQNPTGKWNQL